MKLCVKKIYCPDCRRLVRGREETITGNTRRVFCARCGKALWLWDGITWKYTGRYSDGSARGKKVPHEAIAATSAK